ncbi:MAG: hypothetical protein WAQ25_01055 [Candidatus Saccharimonas sp.]
MQKGDTIIELILAFAIFSLGAVMTVMILNKGVAVSQRSLEKSLVRQQVDGQAEVLRYLRDTRNTRWTEVKALVTPSPLGLSGPCPAVATISGTANGFFVVPDSSDATGFALVKTLPTSYAAADGHARIDSAAKKAYGMWVQVARAEDGGSGIRAYDFYIHGCWDSIGQDVPMTVGTVVRLYDRN